MQVEKHKVVSIEYTLTGPDGKVLDSSRGRAPLEYLHGVGGLIPGLEKELEHKEVGDKLKVTVPPAEAYGERDDRLVRTVMRSRFGKGARVEPGMTFHTQDPHGGHGSVRVLKVEGDVVTVDGNHMLAGMPLMFDVEIVSVRDATAEEIEHGHAHGPGGHHH
jgi:FKBP-type peptidyl-prolyl cis-trans isomerase SlyD